MCRSMVDIQSPTAEIRRGKKKKKIEGRKKEERNYRMKILWSALLHRATITSGQSNLIKGRIAAAYGQYVIYFAMGRPSALPPQNFAFGFPVGGLDPIQHMVPWAHLSPQSKGNLDRFSRFCRAHERDRPTERPRYSVCNNRLHRRMI